MSDLDVHDQIQRLTASVIARTPAGGGLVMIGGFSYRLLRGSVRRSDDIDYHWEGDLEAKQEAVLRTLTSRLLPLLRRQFELDATAGKATRPDAASPFVRTVVVVCTRPGVRVEVPVHITTMPCLDPPETRSIEGTLYLTASDADMVEGKVLALFARELVAHRDLLDLFLYQHHVRPDSAERIASKMRRMGLDGEHRRRVWAYLTGAHDHHVKSLDQLIGEYLDPTAAANLRLGGGGAAVYVACMALLGRLLPDLATRGPA